ncbi:Uncharacterised protein [uncultured archaeon]|nr:Uncharacterised protein [uncultured archaeon]
MSVLGQLEVGLVAFDIDRLDGQLVALGEGQWVGGGDGHLLVVIHQNLADLLVCHEVPVLGCVIEVGYLRPCIGYVRSYCRIICSEVPVGKETNDIILAPRLVLEFLELSLCSVNDTSWCSINLLVCERCTRWGGVS